MNLARWARRTQSQPWPSITIDQLPFWFGQFGYQGLGYGPSMIQTIAQNKETISADFTGFINGAYKTNGAIFACILTRMLLFSEARFQFRRMNNGRPGKLFGTDDLNILEKPWPGGTTGDLLGKAIIDLDLAGNFYATRVPVQGIPRGSSKPQSKIMRLRPDWVTIIKGSPDEPAPNNPLAIDPTAELVGYMYHPGGPGSGLDPHFFLPEEVMHWAPIPDPVAGFRGMSWIQPILTEILGDKAMSTHKMMYFEQGATPNLVVSMDTGKMDRKTFKEWVDAFESEHEGATNAYKTLYLGNGASATVVGTNLKDLDYAIVQGHGETRMAAAAGIPPIIVGFSEGLEAATYSNFAQARRAFADKTLRPLWRNFAGSMEQLVEPPGGSMLWYDDRDIPFLLADVQDNAEVQSTKANAIRQLVDSGFDPDSVVDAVEQNDFTLLTHSGLYSVQLQPAGSTNPGAVIAQPGTLPGPTLPGQQQPGSNGNSTGQKQLPSGSGKANNSKDKKKGLDSTDLPGILPRDRRRAHHLAQALIDAKAGQRPKRGVNGSHR